MAKDTKLEKLYRIMKDSEDVGVRLDESVLKQINELEEKIIKEEVLPLIHEQIEPTLRPVKRNLVLIVDYDPNGSLKVSLSRKVKISAEIEDAKEIQLDPEVEHGSHEYKTAKLTRGSATDMTVIFPDGTVIAEKNAADTLYKTVKKIGVAKVRKVVEDEGLVFCKVPVISNRRDPKYGRSQKDLGEGWLLITHSNNKMKKSFLEKVSDVLNLGLVINIES